MFKRNGKSGHPFPIPVVRRSIIIILLLRVSVLGFLFCYIILDKYIVISYRILDRDFLPFSRDVASLTISITSIHSFWQEVSFNLLLFFHIYIYNICIYTHTYMYSVFFFPEDALKILSLIFSIFTMICLLCFSSYFSVFQFSELLEYTVFFSPVVLEILCVF